MGKAHVCPEYPRSRLPLWHIVIQLYTGILRIISSFNTRAQPSSMSSASRRIPTPFLASLGCVPPLLACPIPRPSLAYKRLRSLSVPRSGRSWILRLSITVTRAVKLSLRARLPIFHIWTTPTIRTRPNVGSRRSRPGHASPGTDAYSQALQNEQIQRVVSGSNPRI